MLMVQTQCKIHLGTKQIHSLSVTKASSGFREIQQPLNQLLNNQTRFLWYNKP